MKYSLVLAAVATAASLVAAPQPMPDSMEKAKSPAVQTVEVPSNSTINLTCPHCPPPAPSVSNDDTLGEEVLQADKDLLISVVGQGVAPMNTTSPAQAYALAKRAAVADAYRLIAEKVKGVRVDGQDLIKNMMVKRSTVRTSVQAMVRNANIVETTFKEGLCEVEMEIVISHSQFK